MTSDPDPDVDPDDQQDDEDWIEPLLSKVIGKLDKAIRARIHPTRGNDNPTEAQP